MAHRGAALRRMGMSHRGAPRAELHGGSYVGLLRRALRRSSFICTPPLSVHRPQHCVAGARASALRFVCQCRALHLYTSAWANCARAPRAPRTPWLTPLHLLKLTPCIHFHLAAHLDTPVGDCEALQAASQAVDTPPHRDARVEGGALQGAAPPTRRGELFAQD